LIGNVSRHKVTAAISMIDRMAKTVDLTKLVSGSDDGSVKLWDMNQAILLLHLLCVSF
jgi:WD40 repeat protein